MPKGQLPFARLVQRVQPLSNTARSGRYARGQVWRRHKELLRKIGWHLAAGAVLLIALCITSAYFLEDEQRGFVLGAGLVAILGSFEWCVFMWSGSASSLSGAMAESNTATDLNRLKKRGWQVVHGLKLRVQSDIDHIAIGPGGVLVVETKWSAEPWPPNREVKTFMSSRLQDAIAQTERAVTHVKGTFGASTKRPGVTKGVLVLSSPSTDEAWPPYVVGQTVVLRAGVLDEWLPTLADDALTHGEIAVLAGAIAAKDAQLAHKEAELGTRIPPTLHQLFHRWLVAFPMTAALGFLAIAMLASWKFWFGWLSGVALTALVAQRLWNRPWWRPFVLGLLVSSGIYSGAVLFWLGRWALNR